MCWSERGIRSSGSCDQLPGNGRQAVPRRKTSDGIPLGAIPCAGKQAYAPRYRVQWLGKITEAGVRRRAEFYYQQLDALSWLRQRVRRELLAESGEYKTCRPSCPLGLRQ